MDTDRLAQLKSRADVELAQISAAKRRLERASRLAERRAQRLVETVSEVAFVLFVWSCPDASLALAYVAAQEGRRKMPFPTVTKEALEDRYLEMPVEVVGDFWRGAGGCSRASFAEAKRFYRDYVLSEWVSEQNERKGVAPTPKMVIRRLRGMSDTREPFARVAQRVDHSWASRKWVQRWRHRWGMRFGSFGVREHVSAADKLEKARCSVLARCSLRPPIARARLCETGGRHAVPFWGPHENKSTQTGPRKRPPFF